MTSTIVTEEKIFESKQNIRTDLTMVRKAVGAEDLVVTTRSLNTDESYSISNIKSYLHIHSNGILNITLEKEGSSLTISTNILTIASSFDSIVIENLQDSEASYYIVYS